MVSLRSWTQKVFTLFFHQRHGDDDIIFCCTHRHYTYLLVQGVLNNGLAAMDQNETLQIHHDCDLCDP